MKNGSRNRRQRIKLCGKIDELKCCIDYEEIQLKKYEDLFNNYYSQYLNTFKKNYYTRYSNKLDTLEIRTTLIYYTIQLTKIINNIKQNINFYNNKRNVLIKVFEKYYKFY